MPKRSRVMDIKQASMLETRVFEDGCLDNEAMDAAAEFTFRDLKRWGFDLFSGWRDGEPAWFLAEVEDGRRAGDVWQEDALSYQAEAMHEALPDGAKLLGRLAMREGQARLLLALEGVEEALADIPAAELLIYSLSREGRFAVLGALRDVGRMTALEASHGQEGKAISLGDLPAVFHRVLREARELGRETGGGRIALAGFGRARDGRHRYRMHWLLPTLALFRGDVAEKADKLLDALP